MRPMWAYGATIRCPAAYGKRLRSTKQCSPRCRIRRAGSSVRSSSPQKMQAERPPPTYSMRHGAQSGRRGSSTLAVLPSSAPRLVDPLLELLTDLEERSALGGDLHLGTGLRVPALAGLAN